MRCVRHMHKSAARVHVTQVYTIPINTFTRSECVSIREQHVWFSLSLFLYVAFVERRV